MTNDQKKWKYLKDYIFRKLINWSKKFLNFTLLTQDEGKLIKWENREKQLKEMNLIWNDTLRSHQEDDDMILLLSGSDIISKLEFSQWNISPVVMMITHIRKIWKIRIFHFRFLNSKFQWSNPNFNKWSHNDLDIKKTMIYIRYQKFQSKIKFYLNIHVENIPIQESQMKKRNEINNETDDSRNLKIHSISCLRVIQCWIKWISQQNKNSWNWNVSSN